MNPHDPLSDLLRSWRYEPPDAADFNQAVWSRVHEGTGRKSAPARPRASVFIFPFFWDRSIAASVAILVSAALGSAAALAYDAAAHKKDGGGLRSLDRPAANVGNNILVAFALTMKRSVALLVLAVVTALSAFGVTRWLRPTQAPVDEMVWLRQEFKLTPDQSATIENLHRAYQPICADHCARIADLQAKLDRLAQAGMTNSSEYTAVKTQWDALRNECASATTKHLQAVAAAMSPDQGARYLRLIGPRVALQEHKQPLGLQ